MVLIGSLSSLERHRSSTKCASSHELIFWNILDMSDQRYFFECQFSLVNFFSVTESVGSSCSVKKVF